MNPTEAVVLLSECKDLADKQVSQGPDVYLDKAEVATLRGFKAVKEAGWHLNYDVKRLAGITSRQVEALEAALIRQAGRLGK